MVYTNTYTVIQQIEFEIRSHKKYQIIVQSMLHRDFLIMNAGNIRKK